MEGEIFMSTKKKNQSVHKIGDIRTKSRELGVVRGRVSRSFDAPRLLEIKRVEDEIMSSKNAVNRNLAKTPGISSAKDKN